MKMYVISKQSMIDLIETLRNMGYKLITFGTELSELERDNDLIVIERRK